MQCIVAAMQCIIDLMQDLWLSIQVLCVMSCRFVWQFLVECPSYGGIVALRARVAQRLGGSKFTMGDRSFTVEAVLCVRPHI